MEKNKRRRKVSILVLEECTPMAPISMMEILNKASVIHQQVTGATKPFFETELVGIKSKKVKVSSRLDIQCHTTLDQLTHTDLILIPSIEFDVERKLKMYQPAIQQLKKFHKKGTELGGMCTGSFVLAATGLLENKSATTHWYVAPTFRTMFPNVKLEDHKIIVDENGLYSSGGATSSMHLGLYLTEKYCGKETANIASRMLLMDSNYTSQTRFSIFIPQTQHHDDAIHATQKVIEADHDEKLSVDYLADAANLSKRSFIRRFKAATGNTPIEYLQRMNVEKAKRQLESNKSSIEQIIYSLGYNDINSFRKIFNRYTNLTPSEYRERYAM